MDINAPAFRPYPTGPVRNTAEATGKEEDEALIRLTGVGDPNLDPLRTLSEEQAVHAFDDIRGRGKTQARTTQSSALSALRAPFAKARPSNVQKWVQPEPVASEKARLAQTFAPIDNAQLAEGAKEAEEAGRGTEATGEDVRGKHEGHGLSKKLGKIFGNKHGRDRQK